MAEWLCDRAHVRNLFLRLLGVIFLIAFLSLYVQVEVLIGSRGLLPAAAYLRTIGSVSLLDAPTIFQIDCSDRALHGAALAGAVLSFGLILSIAPRYALILLWVLYLSFVTVGQDFFSFQWDNLLLETAFFSLFVTPGGLRPKQPPAPHPIAVFLMLWLVFRLNVESGLAKLLTGDPTWRNLTALVSYYETAPLPTWVGWYAHQMPVWAHRLTALFTLVVEIGLPFFIWGPHRVRAVVFGVFALFQLSILLTANYGFFNYLSLCLLLWVLDDGHIVGLATRVRVPLRPPRARPAGRARTWLLAAMASLLIPVSVVPFLRLTPWRAAFGAIDRALDAYRSLNAYHLFASMTLVRREAVIEGSDDGEHWQEYEFCFKPGNPSRPPPFVAPYQPRVDFQLWFLLLGPHRAAPYFDTLLARLLQDPASVASLFCREPFGVHPPRFLRVAVYQYHFTDWDTRRRTGRWWGRRLLGTSDIISRDQLRRE
jgi:hypothetical protein